MLDYDEYDRVVVPPRGLGLHDTSMTTGLHDYPGIDCDYIVPRWALYDYMAPHLYG